MRGHDDWPEYGPASRRSEGSGRDNSRPGPSSAAGLYTAWREAVTPLEIELRDVKWTVARPIFNKHVRSLQDAGSSPAHIRAMFAAFVADVAAGGVLNLSGKTAWFVFYGRRQHYVSVQPEEAREPRKLRSLKDRG